MKERRPLSGTCELIQNSHTFQRGRIALLICVGILLSFLFLSRYPALLAEYVRASTSTLLDRDVGMLSKDAMLMTHNVKGSFELFLTASIDWFDTNKIGIKNDILSKHIYKACTAPFSSLEKLEYKSMIF